MREAAAKGIKRSAEIFRREAERPRRRRDAELRPLIAQSFATSRRTYVLPARAARSPGSWPALRQEPHRPAHARIRPEAKAKTPLPTPHHRQPPRSSRRRELARQDARAGSARPHLAERLTYLETAEGWLFLAFTLDACTRRCVAHHCSADMRGELTTTTLALAIHREPPPPGLLHHNDRGVQYAATDYQDLATAHGPTLSMSRTANPYDNALAESFVAILKAECFIDGLPPSRAAA